MKTPTWRTLIFGALILLSIALGARNSMMRATELETKCMATLDKQGEAIAKQNSALESQDTALKGQQSAISELTKAIEAQKELIGIQEAALQRYRVLVGLLQETKRAQP